MFTYEIRLFPKPGTIGGTLTTQIRASSDIQARMLAEAQYMGYQVQVVRRVTM